MRDTAGADLLLLSLRDFLAGAKDHLSSSVSDTTLAELSEVSESIDALVPDAFRDSSAYSDLLSLSPREFERLIHYLLIRLGYGVDHSQAAADGGVDFVLSDQTDPDTRTILVEAKRWRGAVSRAMVHQLLGAMTATSVRYGLFITTGSFTSAAVEAAQHASVQLIDGQELVELLASFGIHATINAPRESSES